ncbi:MAG: IS630 family transposase [Candidatus Bathyarchaeota archaeon]
MKHLSEEELESLIKNEKNKRLAERLIFIRSLYAGEDVETAIKKLGRCRATGFWWLRRWNNHGLEGLKPGFGGGRPSKLSSAEREELKQKLQSRSYWTTKEALQLIRDEFGKDYHPVSVSRILRSLGMRFGKPYPRDYRRPDDAEAKLKLTLEDALKRLDDIEAQKPEEAVHGEEEQDCMVVGFLDECSPQTCANTVRVYSFDKPIAVKDTKKYRANTIGFYAPFGVSVAGFMENSRKENVCGFLEDVRECNPKSRIVMVLDNFPSHKSNLTKEKAEALGIVLAFIPPWSPDLNPIEQLWRCLKREVSVAFFRSEEEFLSIIMNSWSQLSKRLSFASNWFSKFLPQESNLLCN